MLLPFLVCDDGAPSATAHSEPGVGYRSDGRSGEWSGCVSEAGRAGRAMLVADVAGVCNARARRRWIIDDAGGGEVGEVGGVGRACLKRGATAAGTTTEAVTRQ